MNEESIEKIYNKNFTSLFLLLIILAIFFVIFTVFPAQSKDSGRIETIKVSNMELGCDDIAGGGEGIACT